MEEITETIVTHSRVSPRRRSTSKYRPPKNNTDTSNTNNPDVFKKNHSTKNSNSNNYDNLRINSNSTNDTDNHYDDNRQQQTRSQPTST